MVCKSKGIVVTGAGSSEELPIVTQGEARKVDTANATAEELLYMIYVQMKINNLHMEDITGNQYEEADVWL